MVRALGSTQITSDIFSTRHHFQVPISGHSPHWAIVEDYSDLGIDEDDEWQEKFADFKMKTSVWCRLSHLNDIKPVGPAPVSPSAKLVLLPDVLNAIGHSRTVAPTEPSHPVVGITCLNTLCRHCSSTPGCQTSLG
ncbi:hypothetical protein BJV77DRAFT_1014453 [Russula vinacea]|nr:hypothetical protein BJV77DRAFT_1014453 [Russula vinacea]